MKSMETVDRMVDRIVERFHPQKIILFGSHARGDARSGSDFDLLIVAPSDEPRWRRTVPVYRLLAGLGIPKDIVWWTPEEIAEWQGVKSHFINTVLREGKVLYSRTESWA
jgi:predicted nucleotidyltransferase